jgi:hypothetical protein
MSGLEFFQWIMGQTLLSPTPETTSLSEMSWPVTSSKNQKPKTRMLGLPPYLTTSCEEAPFTLLLNFLFLLATQRPSWISYLL